MFKQNYHLLFLVSACLLLSCSIITTKNTKKISKTEQLPGYYGQWLFIKTNGTNILPDISRYNWMPTNTKRATSNALLNVSEMGPDNVGGRTRAVLVDKRDPNRIIAGGVSGGIFVSNNKGLSWAAINDQQLTPSITGIVQNPITPDIIYYCTGEGSGNSADIIGAGVFKSTDGGNSFTQLASTKTGSFNICWSIRCSPIDTNTLFVSTGSSGVWKSTDAGTTFKNIFPSSVEINDMEILPDGSVLIAIKGSGVYRSPNGNNGTFTKVNSIVSTSTARGELAFCKDFPNVVYAGISSPDNGYNGFLQDFYKSSDGGKTFTKKTNPNGVVSFSFTWYCLTMAVKDNDSNSIFIASLNSGYSYDGGMSWNNADDMHSDHHVSINIAGDKLLVGCDGGICIYPWSDFSQYTSLNNGLNITQFYSGAVSPHASDIMGGCQDNGTNESQSGSSKFSHIYGGDGAYAFYHNSDPDVRFVAYQNGIIHRLDAFGDNAISNNLPANTDAKWFIQPYDVSTFNSNLVVYPSGLNIYYSLNAGDNFSKLGNITTGRLFAAGSSQHINPVVYSGGQNSLIAFDSVLNIKPVVYNLFSKLPLAIKGSFLNCVKVIPGYRDRVYLAYSNIYDSGRLYKGVGLLSGTPKFKNISGNLPKGLPVNWVECDPRNPEKTIFAGTDFGLYVTEDSGTTWVKDSRIPNVVISSIKIRSNDKEIYFFTHGRGVFKGLINNNVDLKTNNIIAKNSLMTLYPVPAANLLNIKVQKDYIGGNYRIYNLSGQVVLEGKLDKDITEILTSELANGNYIFYVQNKVLSEHQTFSILK